MNSSIVPNTSVETSSNSIDLTNSIESNNNMTRKKRLFSSVELPETEDRPRIKICLFQISSDYNSDEDDDEDDDDDEEDDDDHDDDHDECDEDDKDDGNVEEDETKSKSD
jgi:hypothetical protein